MKQLYCLLTLFMCLSVSSTAQVGINSDGNNPDPSAMLDIKSTEKGLLTPRMTRVQMMAISSPANGLVVFCTTDNKFYVFTTAANSWEGILLGSESDLNNESFYFSDSLRIIIPDTIPVAVGVECNLYKDNISNLIPDKSDYFVSTMTSSAGSLPTTCNGNTGTRRLLLPMHPTRIHSGFRAMSSGQKTTCLKRSAKPPDQERKTCCLSVIHSWLTNRYRPRC
jgi:hypothetical protein